MAGHPKIDILIMRGAGRVGRYHVSPGWLRALWLTPLCLALLLAGATAVAWRLREANSQLSRRVEALSGEREGVGERLLRLENIEKILRSKDTTELETLLASFNPDNPGWWKPKSEAHKDATETRERDAPKPDLSKLLARFDSNQAGVDNLRTKIENRKLQLNFDLSNLSPQSTLSGRGEVSLIGNDASLTLLKADRDELSFQIQRFKQIAVSLPLPAKYDPKDIYGLRVNIFDPAGKLIYSHVFPIAKE
jgi:hypothetical protein